MPRWIFVGNDTDSIRRMAGLATPMALRVAVTLSLPDRLLGHGAAADGLAVELGLSPVALDLLLGHLTTLGIVERVSDCYRTTGYGANLCADAGNGLANLLHLDSAAGRAELALVELAHSITTGQAAYSRRYGQDFWADLAEHPHLRETFDRQMTQRFRDQIPQIVAGFDWPRFSTVVDVGGGQGTLLAAILTAHPRMRGHLVDLEPTAADASRTFSAYDLDDRTEVTAGSFFDPLPAGRKPICCAISSTTGTTSTPITSWPVASRPLARPAAYSSSNRSEDFEPAARWTWSCSCSTAAASVGSTSSARSPHHMDWSSTPRPP
jgi:hypothetical protein